MIHNGDGTFKQVFVGHVFFGDSCPNRYWYMTVPQKDLGVRFNEGLDQFFVISRKNGQAWKYVGNLSDLGKGSVMYFEAGTLTPGQYNYFRLETCNV